MGVVSYPRKNNHEYGRTKYSSISKECKDNALEYNDAERVATHARTGEKIGAHIILI